jgi:glycerol-3-phosphate dehydrogenase
MEGLITISGGKLITYRKMAEQATDLACRKLGVEASCTTATTPLPGSEEKKSARDVFSPSHKSNAAKRHGTRANQIPSDSPQDRTLICECEHVSVGEVKYAIDQLHAIDLVDLLRRTRMGMGMCQGKNCSCRIANLMARLTGDTAQAQQDLNTLLDERWKGLKPIAWGQILRDTQLTVAIYQGLCGLDKAIAGRKEGQP